MTTHDACWFFRTYISHSLTDTDKKRLGVSSEITEDGILLKVWHLRSGDGFIKRIDPNGSDYINNPCAIMRSSASELLKLARESRRKKV